MSGPVNLRPVNPGRRQFLQASATAGGGLLLAFHIPGLAAATDAVMLGPVAPLASDEINAWLTINEDDTITIRVAQSEMGQGVYTALPMIIAEELEVDWRQVKAEHASANRSLRQNRVYRQMSTNSSGAVRRSRVYLQQAGAEARQRLIEAAARQWGVASDTCNADYGQVHHKPSGRAVNYGAIAAAAAAIDPAMLGDIVIKTPEQFNLLGVPTRRLDVPAKVDGSAIYGMDVRLPNMVYAAVVHCPVLGGTLRGYRFNVVRDRPGVISAVRLPNGAAIIAETFWAAKNAVEAMPVDWVIGDAAKVSSASLRGDYLKALEKPGVLVAETGNAMQAMEDAQTSIESDYLVPYLAHTCMEPLNCTVSISDDRVDVWGGFQDPEGTLKTVAEVTGRDAAQVHVHTCMLGGGFGRRMQTDFAREAATIAMQSGRPVQMIWSREEDTRQGNYRPMAAIRFKAGFSLEKQLVAYTNHSVVHSIGADRGSSSVKGGLDATSLEGLAELPYAIANKRITHTIKNSHLTSWYWRSVGASHNGYARECFVDEMAQAAGQDPFVFRQSLMGAHPRSLHVLEELKSKSQWGKSLPPGSAQGMAIMECFGTVCGQVAEVTLSESGQLTVDRIVSVLDCGNLVNPLSAEEQVESAILYGLTAALYGKLTIEKGQILEDNFDLQRILRMDESPLMETHWALSGGDTWGGLGEPGTPCVAPAVCNALYRVTGRRIRSLPITDYFLQRK